MITKKDGPEITIVLCEVRKSPEGGKVRKKMPTECISTFIRQPP